MSARYPGAIWRPSVISHPMRDATLGIVEHWTAGREPGDVITLDGPNVDCHFYIAKDGDVYQFLDLMSQAWHAFYMANHYCVGIEHEGFGEPWTPAQFAATVKVQAWVCKRLGIPIKHVDPSGHDVATFKGLFGHRDLSLGGVRVDGNDHTDTVPSATGWDRFLTALRKEAGAVTPSDSSGVKPTPPDYSKLPYDGAMRVVVGGRKFAGWEDCVGPIKWITRNTLKSDQCAVSYRGPSAKTPGVWRGAKDVTNVCKSLVKTYKL